MPSTRVECQGLSDMPRRNDCTTRERRPKTSNSCCLHANPDAHLLDAPLIADIYFSQHCSTSYDYPKPAPKLKLPKDTSRSNGYRKQWVRTELLENSSRSPWTKPYTANRILRSLQLRETYSHKQGYTDFLTKPCTKYSWKTTLPKHHWEPGHRKLKEKELNMPAIRRRLQSNAIIGVLNIMMNGSRRNHELKQLFRPNQLLSRTISARTWNSYSRRRTFANFCAQYAMVYVIDDQLSPVCFVCTRSSAKLVLTLDLSIEN